MPAAFDPFPPGFFELPARPDGLETFFATLAVLTPPAEAWQNPAAALFRHLPMRQVLPALKRLATIDPQWLRVVSPEGHSLMSMAAYCCHAEAFRWALAQGLDPRGTPDPMKWALTRTTPVPDLTDQERDAANETIVRTLLATGRYSAEDLSVAVAWAADSNARTGLLALLDHGARVALVPASAFSGTEAKPDAPPVNPLKLAVHVRRNQADAEAVMAMLLAQDGIQPLLDQGWGDTPACGGSPLHHAVGGGEGWAVPLLVKAGASVNPPAWLPEGPVDTPLMWAATTGSLSELLTLVRDGANGSPVDAQGCSALHLLADADLQDEDELEAACTAALLGAGADPLLRDAKGRTPLEIAEANDRSGVRRVLRAFILEATLEVALEPGKGGRKGPRLQRGRHTLLPVPRPHPFFQSTSGEGVVSQTDQTPCLLNGFLNRYGRAARAAPLLLSRAAPIAPCLPWTDFITPPVGPFRSGFFRPRLPLGATRASAPGRLAGRPRQPRPRGRSPR